VTNAFLGGCPRASPPNQPPPPRWRSARAPRELALALRERRRRRVGGCRAILFEPPQFELNEKEKERQQAFPGAPPQPREVGSGHGVLYDTPQRGTPAPFGAVARAGGVNFAVQSSAATAARCASSRPRTWRGAGPAPRCPWTPAPNRTGAVWHAFLPGLSAGLLYGFRVGAHGARGGAALLTPPTSWWTLMPRYLPTLWPTPVPRDPCAKVPGAAAPRPAGQLAPCHAWPARWPAPSLRDPPPAPAGRGG